MRWVRTWLPLAIIASGLGLMAVVRDENGLEGGVLLVSAGMSVWLLNWFYRVGVRGDRERDSEDEARAFFDRHGHWPDEAPPEGEPPRDRELPRAGEPPRDREPPRAGEPPREGEPPRDPHRRRPPSGRFDRPGSRPRRPGP